MTSTSGSKVESNVANQMSFACCSALSRALMPSANREKIFLVFKRENMRSFLSRFSSPYFIIKFARSRKKKKTWKIFHDSLSALTTLHLKWRATTETWNWISVEKIKDRQRTFLLSIELEAECYRGKFGGNLSFQNVTTHQIAVSSFVFILASRKMKLFHFHRFHCCWIVGNVIMLSSLFLQTDK